MIYLEEKNREKESTGEQNKGRKKEPTVVIKGKKKKGQQAETEGPVFSNTQIFKPN